MQAQEFARITAESRTKDEIERWKERDPIAALTRALSEAGEITDADVAAMETQVAEEVEGAIAFAEAGTLEPVEELTRFVHSDRAKGEGVT